MERRLLNTLAREPHDTSEHASPRVDSKALATVRTNRYSVPAALAGLNVAARIGARDQLLARRQAGRTSRALARQERHERAARSYLDLLRRKPGALARSLALRQQRDRGDWPACLDELWDKIAERAGRQEAARQMVDVLLLCREHPLERVELAVRGALTAGAHDGKAVALLARQAQRPAPAGLDIDDKLAAIGAPPPDDLSGYDALREDRS
ncbi:MAG: hypothetical protein QOJ63_841 [Solirubrobacteraceae bacterium]|jgi:hypothetical protein|nr:hypothetical protein [Solirubrobacteraceae bacterium]